MSHYVVIVRPQVRYWGSNYEYTYTTTSIYGRVKGYLA